VPVEEYADVVDAFQEGVDHVGFFVFWREKSLRRETREGVLTQAKTQTHPPGKARAFE
jgi:hypothetical protein